MNTTNPDVMPEETLKGKAMQVLSYYDIMENDDKELLFAIKYLDSPLLEEDSPVMYYDGGPHAILVKNDDLAVICDFVHPGVRGSLGKVKEVLVAELVDGSIKEEYTAEMRHVQGIEEIAEGFVAKKGSKQA